MTFKDLQKVIESQPDYSNSQQSEMLQRLRGKPFWIWDSATHKVKDRTHKGDCCFNDIIGLPKKNGKRHPIYDYEKMLYMALVRPGYLNGKAAHPMSNTAARYRYDYRLPPSQYTRDLRSVLHGFKEKHLWVKKATGLGVTEFMLRFMVWLCVRDDKCKGLQMCIVTGPRIELAIELVSRIKKLFEPHGVLFTSKETVVEINGVTITAYPSNHLDSMRGLTNISFILLEESDFFPKHEQQNARDISERYIAKSSPWIVLVSTPNAPGGLFQQIEQEPFDKCIYKKIFLDYTYGLGLIYTRAEIEKAKQSPSFPREYELQYLGIEGNVFSTQSIELCQKVEYNPTVIVRDAPKSMGIDPAYGSSNFAITVTQLVDGKIQVIESSEWARPGFNEMVEKVMELMNKCGHISNIYVDASNPGFIQQLKQMFNESYDDQFIRDKQAYCRKYNLHLEDQMFVCPTPFSIENKKMLSSAKWLMDEKEEDGSSLIAIHPSFDKLLISLRTATVSEWKLQKDQTSFNDILDSFLMALQYYKRTNE